MVGQFNEEKVNKYFYRLRKAFVQNNKEKSQEYLSHLKYHVMVGGEKTIDEQIGEKLGKISELITNINTETSSKLVDFKKQIADKENELVQLRNQLQTKTNELGTAIGDKDKLSLALNEASNQINLAQQSAKTSEDTYNAQLQELQKKLFDSDAKITEISKSIGDTATEMVTKDNEISDLKKRVEDLTASNESEKQAKDAEIVKLTDLKKSINDILIVLAQNMNVATTQVASLEASSQDLFNKVAESAGKIAELEEQVRSATAEKDQAIKEKDEAKNSMDTTSQERLTQLDDVIDQLKEILIPIKYNHPPKEKVESMIEEYTKMNDGEEKIKKKDELSSILDAYRKEKEGKKGTNAYETHAKDIISKLENTLNI